MSTLVVPAIAALSALAVAIVSAWMTRRNSRQLEILKAALAGHEIRRGLLREELRKILTQMDTLISDLQRVRDAILLIGGTAAVDAALSAFSEAHDKLLLDYAAASAVLPEEELTMAHAAKSLIIRVRHRLATEGATGRISDTLRNELWSVRANLGEVQFDLRQARLKQLLHAP